MIFSQLSNVIAAIVKNILRVGIFYVHTIEIIGTYFFVSREHHDIAFKLPCIHGFIRWVESTIGALWSTWAPLQDISVLELDGAVFLIRCELAAKRLTDELEHLQMQSLRDIDCTHNGNLTSPVFIRLDGCDAPRVSPHEDVQAILPHLFAFVKAMKESMTISTGMYELHFMSAIGDTLC